ncbi:MAG TPA: GNAT family N-acetyltransferase [Aliidongia sp.]|nr:GNAT family N-acetyltransferase [Aliidongia sp.]
MQAVPILETPRLRLRRHEPSDFPVYAALWSHPDIVRFIGGRSFTEEEVWARIQRYVGHWTLFGFGFWAIEERATGDLIGEIGFADFRRDNIPASHGCPETGWMLAPDKHGQGYATEAALAVHEWGDGNFTVEHTFCMIQIDNRASIRVAEKIGYRLREETTYRDRPMYLFDRARGG